MSDCALPLWSNPTKELWVFHLVRFLDVSIFVLSNQGTALLNVSTSCRSGFCPKRRSYAAINIWLWALSYQEANKLAEIRSTAAGGAEIWRKIKELDTSTDGLWEAMITDKFMHNSSPEWKEQWGGILFPRKYDRSFGDTPWSHSAVQTSGKFTLTQALHFIFIL